MRYRRIKTIVFFFILASTFFGCAGTPKSKNVVEVFIESIVKKDLNSAMRCVDPKIENIYNISKQFFAIDKMFPDYFLTMDMGFNLLNYNFISEEISGENSVVKVEFLSDQIDTSGIHNLTKILTSFNLVKFKVGWRIVNVYDISVTTEPINKKAILLFPVEGDRWFNSYDAKSTTHTINGGFNDGQGHADDTFALDLNLPNHGDKGKEVYPVEDGEIVPLSLGALKYGFVLIKHIITLELSDGTTYEEWYSGYMHMENCRLEGNVYKNHVSENVIGFVSNVNTFSHDMKEHLHFAIYYRDKSGKLVSIDLRRITGFSGNYFTTN